MTKLDESHHPKVEAMARLAEWFFLSALANNRSAGTTVVLCGPTGTGKTDTARRVRSGIAGWAVSAKVDGDGWKSSFPHVVWLECDKVVECEVRFNDCMADLSAAGIVFIDDLGAEIDTFKSGLPAARLRRIFAECANKWLFITSNLSRASLADAYDARIADRLSGAHWCDMTGVPSYRPKLK